MKSAKTNDGFLIRCDIGDEVVSTLTEFAAKNDISSGTVSGIGALKEVALGYFDLSRKEYLRREFDGIYELLSLSGNFSRKNGETVLHCHALISGPDYTVYGGHLFSGLVAVTGEFYIRPVGIKVTRNPDPATGLNLINL